MFACIDIYIYITYIYIYIYMYVRYYIYVYQIKSLNIPQGNVANKKFKEVYIERITKT